MFLLIQKYSWCWLFSKSSLHSTMFLLIQNQFGFQYMKDFTLHSTMFLLIPFMPAIRVSVLSCFTFHNVSINTFRLSDSQYSYCSLHSTMFLLIQYTNRFISSSFSTLHSTMFLLILWTGCCWNWFIFHFTFHNVSINTVEYLIQHFPRHDFTFHNVSINTQ